MQKLWEHGVNVWDGYKKEHFNLKAIIFLHDQWQSHTLSPYRAGQRKGRMCHLHGLDGINLSSIFK
jgi:hypothetical protein